MFLIVGLGNPEKKYEKTFHNMGFLAVGEAAAKLGVKFKKKECEASVAEAFIGGEKVILARPVTYMNASGRAVKQLMAKYKVSPSELLVIYDDFDLPKGKLRIRASGSAGTHNGMRSIIGEIGSSEFPRIRIGITTRTSTSPSSTTSSPTSARRITPSLRTPVRRRRTRRSPSPAARGSRT